MAESSPAAPNLFRRDRSAAKLPPLDGDSEDALTQTNPLAEADSFLDDDDDHSANGNRHDMSLTGETTYVDTVVIGAGISGLTAAYRLQQSLGQRVAVVEAKGRIGGRIQSTIIPSRDGYAKFDVGGQWVSDTQPHILSLLKELGLSTYKQFDTGRHAIQLSDGSFRSYAGFLPTSVGLMTMLNLGLIVELLEHRVRSYLPYSSLAIMRDDTTTVHSYVGDFTTRFTASRTLNIVNSICQICFGRDSHQLSVAAMLHYAHGAGGFQRLCDSGPGDGQQSKVVGCAGGIVDRLADRVGREHIVLSSPVCAIEQDIDGVTVVSRTGTYRARHVVVATPPHLMPQIDMTPALPPQRRRLMSDMPVGHLIKYLVTYSTHFWRERGLSGQVLSSSGPICFVCDASTSDDEPALVAFVGGTSANQLCQLDAEQRKQLVLAQLETMFGPDALSPVYIVEKDWAQEPFNGGCPVGIPLIGTARSMPLTMLREPFGRVVFAGTELGETWRGFMNGAVESAERAVAQIRRMHEEDNENSADTALVASSQETLRTGYVNFAAAPADCWCNQVFPVVALAFAAAALAHVATQGTIWNRVERALGLAS